MLWQGSQYTARYGVESRCQPLQAECHYEDPATGTLHVFKSRDLFFYPAELEDQEIKVYVEQGNMDHYYVDVESVVPDIQVH